MRWPLRPARAPPSLVCPCVPDLGKLADHFLGERVGVRNVGLNQPRHLRAGWSCRLRVPGYRVSGSLAGEHYVLAPVRTVGKLADQGIPKPGPCPIPARSWAPLAILTMRS